MQPYVVKLLCELIAFNTANLPGNEAPAAHYLEEVLSAAGFVTQLVDHGNNRASLLASIGPDNGKSICFNGHIDVVPAMGAWDSDPFTPVVKDGRVYGRGAADMKGGVAAMAAAALEIAARKEKMTGKLVLTFVADEEIGAMGTCALLKHPLVQKTDYAIIGEPTLLSLCIAHKGTLRFVLEVIGKSCHSGVPHNGVNAIEKSHLALQAVTAYNRWLTKKTHALLPAPTATVTNIQGGEKDNIVPASCKIIVDRRLIPGETQEIVWAEFTRFLETQRALDPQFAYKLHAPYIHVPAGEVDPTAKVVEDCRASFARALGGDCTVTAFPATCEQAFFTLAGIPAVIIGPGSIEQAHVVNEWISIEQLTQAQAFYTNLASSVLF